MWDLQIQCNVDLACTRVYFPRSGESAWSVEMIFSSPLQCWLLAHGYGRGWVVKLIRRRACETTLCRLGLLLKQLHGASVLDWSIHKSITRQEPHPRIFSSITVSSLLHFYQLFRTQHQTTLLTSSDLVSDEPDGSQVENSFGVSDLSGSTEEM